jgi:hypothetical protein
MPSVPQPIVPFWLAAVVVVVGAVITYVLASADATVLTPLAKLILGAANIALTTLAALLNIRRPATAP